VKIWFAVSKFGQDKVFKHHLESIAFQLDKLLFYQYPVLLHVVLDDNSRITKSFCQSRQPIVSIHGYIILKYGLLFHRYGGILKLLRSLNNHIFHIFLLLIQGVGVYIGVVVHGHNLQIFAFPSTC